MIPPIRSSPSLLLLISLVALVLVAPQVRGRALPAYVVTILLALVLLSALRATADTRRLRAIGTVLGLVWITLNVWSTTMALPIAERGSQLVFIGFSSFTIILLIRRIVNAEAVNFEIVCASPSVYLLIAIAWAVSYDMIESISPGAFRTAHEGVELGFSGFLYFSLTTITTLGYGDITPVRPTAGIWATLEAATGIFFMAILVARLVSLYRR